MRLVRDKVLNFFALKGNGKRGRLLIILSSVLLLFSLLLFAGVNIWNFSRPNIDLLLFFQNRGYVSNPALSNKWGGLTRLIVNGINPVQSNSLPTIHLNIKHKNYIKLLDQNNEGGGGNFSALFQTNLPHSARGFPLAGDPFWVPGTIDYKGETIKVKIRNREGNHDHRTSNKWSFRMHAKGDKSLLGMREFSIQHPKTRMYLMEWVYTNHLLKEGVLSPRYEFINVVFNGTPKGIFSIEEHFSRELIEPQKRREGILLRYDADPAILGHTFQPRFEKSRIEKNDNLKIQYQVAHKLLDDFRNLKKETSRAFDIPITARYLAVTELWNACHGEMFSNIWFYYNPVTSLLEPVGYDGATPNPDFLVVTDRASLGRFSGLCTANTSQSTLELFSDKKLAVAFEKELSRVSSPDYVEQLLQGMADEYKALREDLLMEYPFIPKFSDLYQVMKERARVIRRTDGVFIAPITTDEEINFLPRILGYYTADSEESSKPPTIRLHVANTFPEPIKFFGVEIKNKDGWITIPAKELTVISDISGNPEWLPAKRFRRPSEYRVFSLPQNIFLEGTERKNLSINIIVKAITDDKAHKHPIAYSYFSPITNELTGRMQYPPIEVSLKNHKFLELQGKNILRVKEGIWRVREDILIPSGFVLKMNRGTTLQFGPDAIFATSSPTHFSGVGDQPIVLEPYDKSWGGYVEMNTRNSKWEYVHVKNATSINRNGWLLTGGVTFYKSNIQLNHLSISGAGGEDGLNIIDSKFELENCSFLGASSDAFDGDFVQGKIENCLFKNILGDGLDLSGSTVFIRSAQFENVKDKAISAGERSIVNANELKILKAGTGVASKDGSKVKIVRSSFKEIKNVALMAYVKKTEYEAGGSIIAKEIKVDDPLKMAKAQIGSEITIDKKSISTENVDVKLLYASGDMKR